jgi:hypothetical protein
LLIGKDKKRKVNSKIQEDVVEVEVVVVVVVVVMNRKGMI